MILNISLIFSSNNFLLNILLLIPDLEIDFITKTLLPDNGDFGAIETFNFERTLTNLEQFGDAIKVTDVLKPTGAK